MQVLVRKEYNGQVWREVVDVSATPRRSRTSPTHPHAVNEGRPVQSNYASDGSKSLSHLEHQEPVSHRENDLSP